MSHIEAQWEVPSFRSFVGALAERFTLVRYDTRGQGLSDPTDELSLDLLLDDLELLVDTLRLDEFVLYGQCYGGPLALRYAARHPWRVSKLILDGTYARGAEIMRPERRATFLRALEEMWPDSTSLLAHFTNPDRSHAKDVPMPTRDDDTGATARSVARLYEIGFELDVTEVLPHVQMPALVVHRKRSRVIPVTVARRLAAALPDASFVQLDGAEHNPWEGDAQSALDTIGDFLGVPLELAEVDGAQSVPLAIMFTDMESSTASTSKLGDVRGQELVRTHDAVVRAALKKRGGTEVKHTGDGIMASFQSISAAVMCSVEIQRTLRVVEAPFRIKIGIDAGEPLTIGTDLGGTVVQSTRRIVDRAAPGQILASDVVKKLVAGKGFSFVDTGWAALRGLPEPVRLFEVVWDEIPVAGS
jgi:pimeloyl-ACP methyl ester carboxylesterase